MQLLRIRGAVAIQVAILLLVFAVFVFPSSGDIQALAQTCPKRIATDSEVMELEKTEEDIAVHSVHLLQTPQTLQVHRSPQFVVHFLFMATTGLPHIELWEAFFQSAPVGSWYGWVHCVDYTACSKDIRISNLGLRIVPTTSSEYCVDLVSPGVRMLKSALELGPGVPEKFVLLSDTTLPTKPFQHVFAQLFNHSDSEMCFVERNRWPIAEISHRRYVLVSHHQWFTLTRPHALTFVERWAPPNASTGEWRVPLRGQHGEIVANVSSTLFKNPLWTEEGKEHILSRHKDCGTSLPEFFVQQGMCNDDVATIGQIFGAIEINDDESLKDPGLPNLRERCNLFVKWHYDDRNWTEEPGLAQARLHGDTQWKPIEFPCDLSPVTFDRIGPEGQSMFLQKPELFVRKVASDARLPGYQDRVLLNH